MQIRIKKRNGRLEQLNINKINICVERAAVGLSEVSVSDVAISASLALYDKIPSSEICNALILSGKAKIETEPQYSYLTARLLLHHLYKEVFGENTDSDAFDYQYRKSFVTNIKGMVKDGRLDGRMLDFDLKKLSEKIVPERDNLFKYLGIQILYDRYLLKNGVRKESPQAFWMRVAMGLCYNEENKDDAAIEIYDAMSQFLYCHSTPTLFNSGTVIPQLSSCYLSTVGDSIDGIFGSIHEQARLSKYAGGLGVDFSSVRGSGGYIKGTNGKSNGVVPWLKIFNDTLVAVNQGGRRPGSGCAYLELTHRDIESFIELRKNTGDDRLRCHDMNTAVWVPDKFMEAVESGNSWFVFSPNEAPQLHETYGEEFSIEYDRCVKSALDNKIHNYEKLDAKELWKKILISLMTTGHPWITFKDTSNLRYTDKHCGVVHNSNLCTEILRHNKPNKYHNQEVIEHGEAAVCNLSSINLYQHIIDGIIQWNLLSRTVRTAVRALDRVIDINYYPVKSAEISNLKHRPVGLGIMGFQDVLRCLGILYDSDEAVAIADRIQEFISYHAILASSELAKEKGRYSTYEGSEWSKGIFPIDSYNQWKTLKGIDDGNSGGELDWSPVYKHVAEHGMRNACVMAIAPTATISYLQGCYQSIEPDYSMLWVYSTLSGEFTVINDFFVQKAKNLGIWGKELIDALKRCDGNVALIDGEMPEELRHEFRSVFDLNFDKIIDCAAARQKWIDMGQSFNIYSSSASLRYLNDIYFKCWRSGLKTTYYMRGQASSKVEKSNSVEKTPKTCSITDPTCESCQ